MNRAALVSLVVAGIVGASAMAACSDEAAPLSSPSEPDASATDAGEGDEGDSGADGKAPGWETVEQVGDDGAIVLEKVSYRSQGLRVFGIVCRPKAPGKHKALIYNHGGVEGTGPFTGICTEAAKNGYVVVASSYRGEDGSDGAIEVCLGEVDDVLAITDIARALPYVDADKIAMLGFSHGGCITTRAVQRGAKVAVAIDVFGPKDWAENYHYWKAQRAPDAGPGGVAAHDDLVTLLEQVTGGTPDERPEEYAKRSPIHFVGDLDAFEAPYMAVHGTKDVLVLARDTCRLAARARDMKSYHLDRDLAVVTSEPPGCEGTAVTWLPAPKPSPAWPADRYAVVYDEAGHEIESPSGARMMFDALEFIVAKVP